MTYICKHEDSIIDAYDIKEIFYHHSKVKEEPDILYKIQVYKRPDRRREVRKTYLTTIKLGN